jgi:hypothetical protein
MVPPACRGVSLLRPGILLGKANRDRPEGRTPSKNSLYEGHGFTGCGKKDGFGGNEMESVPQGLKA